MSTEILSDKNVLARRAAVVSKRQQYSDLDHSLTLNQFNDVYPLTDIDAVKNSVKNLILTNFYERPFQPKLGANLRGLLFEPADRITIAVLRNRIKRILQVYEPRVDSVAVQINDDSDRNRYTVTLGFRVISADERVDVTLYLQRIR